MALRYSLALLLVVGPAAEAHDRQETGFVLAQTQTDKQDDELRRKQREERGKGEPQHKDKDRPRGDGDKAAQDKQKDERARADQERIRAQEEQKLHEERSKAAQDRLRADQVARDKAKAVEDAQKQERLKVEQDRAKALQQKQAQEREIREKAKTEQDKKDARTKAEQEHDNAAKGEQKYRDDLNKSAQEKAKADQARKEIERTKGLEKTDMGQQKQTIDRAAGQERLKQERAAQGKGGSEKLVDIQRQRKERTEDGRRIIEEPGKRVIVKEQNRTIIRHDETERFREVARDFRSERRQDGVTVGFYTRPDGSRVISEVDDDGRLLRRYRRMPDGRDIILIDNRGIWRSDRPRSYVVMPVLLPEFLVRIPRERYIVEYSRASDDDIYDVLRSEPLERLERRYSLEEVRWSERLRDRMRRVDLDDINFEFGSWEVTSDQMPRLERLASAMNRILDREPNEVFLIEGHTDAVGSDDDNLTLSDRRAEAVARILTEYFYVPPENLVTQGYGEQFLKVNTQGPERANRRVAIRRITPLLSQGPG